MKRTLILLNMVLICMTIVLSGCKCKNPNCKCKKCECTSCSDSCECIKSCDICGKTPCECLPETFEISKAFLFLDNSASMNGYANDIKNYTDVLTDLVNVYPEKTDIILCSNEYDELDKAKGSLINQVKNMSYGKSSLLDNDLKKMIEKVKCDSSKIAFLVTDGILSGTDEDIRKDRNWTLRNVAQLENNVEQAFRNNPDIAVSVYQFSSNFNGKYICYTNSDQARINTSRYYYIFVVGSKEAVMNFKKAKDRLAHFKPANQLHFIAQHPLSGGISVKGAKKNGGNWEYDQTNLTESILSIRIKHDELNEELDSKELKRLENEISVSPDKGVSLEELSYDEDNHLYNIPLNPKFIPGKHTVEIIIPFKMPSWVVSSSCTDDLYMKSRPDNRTFLLLNLITGIQRGKLAGTDNLYRTDITLIDKNRN